MCDPYTRECLIETGETILAREIKSELGIEIAPEALRVFIRAHWDQIAPLAHRIHEGK